MHARLRSNPLSIRFLFLVTCFTVAFLGATGSAPIALAQDFGTMKIVAGKFRGNANNDIPAADAALSGPWSVAVDSNDTIYVGEYNANRVRRVDFTNGHIVPYVGTGEACSPPAACGAGGPAADGKLFRPRWLTTDGENNLYIAEFAIFPRVRMVRASDGVMVHIAGEGNQTPGSSNCVLAAKASLNIQGGIALGKGGNLYIAGNRIFRIAPDGRYSEVAGGGRPPGGQNGDGGPATAAAVSATVRGIAVDGKGNVFFSDGARIRKIAAGADGIVTGAADEIVTTVAGTGQSGAGTDFVKPTESMLSQPWEIVVDSRGDLFYLDHGLNTIRRVKAGSDGEVNGSDDEIITTVAGGGIQAPTDGLPATEVKFSQLAGGLQLSKQGDLLVSDGAYTVYRIYGVAGPPVQTDRSLSPALGDMNGDGRINIQDATTLLRISVGLLSAIPAQAMSGDVNHDGKLNIRDTTLVLSTAVGNRPACFD